MAVQPDADFLLVGIRGRIRDTTTPLWLNVDELPRIERSFRAQEDCDSVVVPVFQLVEPASLSSAVADSWVVVGLSIGTPLPARSCSRSVDPAGECDDLGICGTNGFCWCSLALVDLRVTSCRYCDAEEEGCQTCTPGASICPQTCD